MKVTIIESDGTIMAEGDWDEKVVEGMYGKVVGPSIRHDSQLYHLAYIYRSEVAPDVSRMLRANEAEFKRAKDLHMKTLYAIRDQFALARKRG